MQKGDKVTKGVLLSAKFHARFSRLRTFNSRIQSSVEPLLRDTVKITQNVTLSNA